MLEMLWAHHPIDEEQRHALWWFASSDFFFIQQIFNLSFCNSFALEDKFDRKGGKRASMLVLT